MKTESKFRTSAVTFHRETVREIFKDGQGLFAWHHEEVPAAGDVPFHLDIDQYLTLEESDGLRIYTARYAPLLRVVSGRDAERIDDGILIGYAIFTIGPHPHHADSLQANQLALYLERKFRKGFLGVNLIKFADSKLQSEGVEIVHHHVPVNNPGLGTILHRLGYTPIEATFARRLS